MKFITAIMLLVAATTLTAIKADRAPEAALYALTTSASAWTTSTDPWTAAVPELPPLVADTTVEDSSPTEPEPVPEPEPPAPAKRMTRVAVTDVGDIMAAIRRCESTDNYSAVDPSGSFRGAYQFNQGTWNGVADRHYPHLVGIDPADASVEDQDAMALALYGERGVQPWPTCGRRAIGG